jgi:hypothetical protein
MVLRAYAAAKISAAELCAQLSGRTWDAMDSQRRVLGLKWRRSPSTFAHISDFVALAALAARVVTPTGLHETR